MARTRTGLLDGALRAVAARGTRRTTMNDIATHAGLAKATLYNHFRTKDDVWAALVAVEVAQLAEECADRPLADALAHAATRIGTHPALRTIARDEPAVLSRLLLGDPPADCRRLVKDLLLRELRHQQSGGGRATSGDGERPDGGQASSAPLDAVVEIVLRWLASYLVRAGAPAEIRSEAERLGQLLRCPPVPG
jgi:AcrR family transcriptional regulator